MCAFAPRQRFYLKGGHDLGNEFNDVKKFNEVYWEKEHERTKAMLKKQSNDTKFEPGVVAFSTMCSLVAGTVILLTIFDLI